MWEEAANGDLLIPDHSHGGREQRRDSLLFWFFHFQGPHLKNIDRAGLLLIENSGGQATAVHQRGIEIDAIGLHVRPSELGMTVHDILLVRRLVSQE